MTPFTLRTRAVESNRARATTRVWGRRLRLVTYNIHHGVSTSREKNIFSVCDVVRGFDVVCLNEVSRTQAKALARSLDLHWVSTDRSMGGQNPYSNNAILSRLPIEESRLHLLPLVWLIPWRRRVLEATLNCNGTPLHVLVTHVSLLPGERAEHLRCAAGALDRLRGPRLLCGDLNAPPDHAEIRQIADSYHDAWGAKGEGQGLTFGTRIPLRRLDYIFASNHLSIIDAQIPDSRQPDGSFPSDHHPVAATLSLP